MHKVAYLRTADGSREPVAEGAGREGLSESTSRSPRIARTSAEGRTNKFVKVGRNAVVNLEDLGQLLSRTRRL